MKRWLALLGSSVILFLFASCQREARPGIQEQRLRDHVTYLASDGLKGRDTGSRGVRLAEEYIASVFEEIGLPPLPGESDYFLDFPLYRWSYDPARTYLAITTPAEGEAAAAAHDEAGELGVDFKPFFFSGAGESRGELVFAGYGITAPEYDYDDYQRLDVEGKVVLVFRHEPEENDPDSVFAGTTMTRHALFTEKAMAAQRRGAAAMILITDPLHHPPGDDLRAEGVFSRNPSSGAASFLGSRMEDFPSLHVSREFIRRCLEPEWKLEDMQTLLDSGRKPADFELPVLSVALGVSLNGTAEEVGCRNVAAYLAGGDPETAEEIIVVGAHHDHIGSFEGLEDAIYNGADDNGSGVAAVLAMAEAFAIAFTEASTEPSRSASPRLPRSLVFVTFAAEEKGLFGSEALPEQWLFPSKEIVFMLNLDMLGRNPERDIDAAVKPGRFRNLLEEANEELGLPIAFRNDTDGGASDSDPFRRRGIPTLFLTTGLHADYHRVTDHADRIEYGRLSAITELCRRFTEAVAEMNGR